MGVSREHLTGYNLIELRIIMQRAIEIMDDLDVVKYPLKNKALQSQLKALLPSLDKETKKYNDMYSVCSEGSAHFYNTVVANAQACMSNHLLDKVAVAQYLAAYDRDPKSIDGIIKKILKQK